MTGNYFCCESKFLPVTARFFLCQETSFCDGSFLPVTRNFIKRQEIFSSGTKALKHNFFQRKEHYSGGRNFLQYFIPSDIKKMPQSGLGSMQGSSSTKSRLPLKLVFHRRLSSTKGRLPLKVVFHRKSSSTEGCLS